MTRNWSYVFWPRPQARKCFVRVVDGRELKRCSGCKRDLPPQAFNKGTGPNGLHRHCRACCAAHRLRKINAGKEAGPRSLSPGGRAVQAEPGLPSPLQRKEP